MANKHFTNFPIVTAKAEKRGIFFRNPMFKRYFELWDGKPEFSAQSAKECKGFWGMVHWILNSNRSIEGKIEFSKESDAAGYSLNSLRSPIYFNRVERTLKYAGDVISIDSKGFNFTDERVGGNCEKEVSVVKVNGKIVFRGRTEVNGYNMTFAHVVEEKIESFLRNGVFKI